MARRQRNTGTVGSRTSVQQGGESFEDSPGTRTLDPLDPELLTYQGPLASVGLSVSVGQATKYGAEKFEVSAWCTLPCRPVPEEIESTYNMCRDIVLEEASRRTNEVIDRFFPDMNRTTQ